MKSEGSITRWLEQLKAGNPEAAQPLWQRYFARLVALARKKLAGRARRADDEEDVALSAFATFCHAAERGQFPRLDDRDDLWWWLVRLTERKASDLVRHERRRKRGGGKVRGESALTGPASTAAEEGGLAQVPGREPTPEFAALIADQCRHLLERLDDDLQRSVALLKLEGYTVPEIADRLGRPLRTVERKLGMVRKIWEAEVAS